MAGLQSVRRPLVCPLTLRACGLRAHPASPGQHLGEPLRGLEPKHEEVELLGYRRDDIRPMLEEMAESVASQARGDR